MTRRLASANDSLMLLGTALLAWSSFRIASWTMWVGTFVFPYDSRVSVGDILEGAFFLEDWLLLATFVLWSLQILGMTMVPIGRRVRIAYSLSMLGASVLACACAVLIQIKEVDFARLNHGSYDWFSSVGIPLCSWILAWVSMWLLLKKMTRDTSGAHSNVVVLTGVVAIFSVIWGVWGLVLETPMPSWQSREHPDRIWILVVDMFGVFLVVLVPILVFFNRYIPDLNERQSGSFFRARLVGVSLMIFGLGASVVSAPFAEDAARARPRYWMEPYSDYVVRRDLLWHLDAGVRGCGAPLSVPPVLIRIVSEASKDRADKYVEYDLFRLKEVVDESGPGVKPMALLIADQDTVPSAEQLNMVFEMSEDVYVFAPMAVAFESMVMRGRSVDRGCACRVSIEALRGRLHMKWKDVLLNVWDC